jgi:hypothetical protein
MNRHASRVAVASLLAGFGAAIGAGAGAQTSSVELAGHRAEWVAHDGRSYQYAYQKYCDCHRDEPPQTFVTVRQGDVTDVFHLHADSAREVPAREGSLDLYWTIDDLFGLIQAALDRGTTHQVTFDTAVGYPNRIYIDYDRDAVGEELDLRLTAFEWLDP